MSREFNPLDEQAQHAAAKNNETAQQLRRANEQDDFRYLMSLPQGRRFVWRLLERAGVFRSSFSMNGLEMAHNEGNRNTGLFVLAEIQELCPERFTQMLKEAKGQHGRGTGKRSTN